MLHMSRGVNEYTRRTREEQLTDQRKEDWSAERAGANTLRDAGRCAWLVRRRRPWAATRLFSGAPARFRPADAGLGSNTLYTRRGEIRASISEMPERVRNSTE